MYSAMQEMQKIKFVLQIYLHLVTQFHTAELKDNSRKVMSFKEIADCVEHA